MAEIILFLLIIGFALALIVWLYARYQERRDRPASFRSLTPHLSDLACAAAMQSVWDWDRAARRFALSAPLERQLGYREGALSGDERIWLALIHPDDRDTCLNGFENYAKYKNSSFRMEFRLRHASGHYVWVELNASMVGERCVGLTASRT